MDERRAHFDLGAQSHHDVRFASMVKPLELEGVGQEVTEEVAHPKTKTDYYHHMVEHHGHDTHEENPDLKHWSKQDWVEQHAEAHEYDDDHQHPGGVHQPE